MRGISRLTVETGMPTSIPIYLRLSQAVAAARAGLLH